jgi:hypothetical protein
MCKETSFKLKLTFLFCFIVSKRHASAYKKEVIFRLIKQQEKLCRLLVYELIHFVFKSYNILKGFSFLGGLFSSQILSSLERDVPPKKEGKI